MTHTPTKIAHPRLETLSEPPISSQGRSKTPLHPSKVKAFLSLFHEGNGISNSVLKRLAPEVYPGDQRRGSNA